METICLNENVGKLHKSKAHPDSFKNLVPL